MSISLVGDQPKNLQIPVIKQQNTSNTSLITSFSTFKSTEIQFGQSIFSLLPTYSTEELDKFDALKCQ